MRRLLLLLPLLGLGSTIRPAPTTHFIGSGDVGKSQFDLLFVSLNAEDLTVDTTTLCVRTCALALILFLSHCYIYY